jgi:hypothetical protein
MGREFLRAVTAGRLVPAARLLLGAANDTYWQIASGLEGQKLFMHGGIKQLTPGHPSPASKVI